jgi:hypothetical protein
VDKHVDNTEWQKWGANYWGANFVWTTLHDFGGTDGLKGKLSQINEIPFAAVEAGANVWGTGFTPEGIDQNPAYYEFMLEANWRTERVPNITEHIVTRSHRRYGFDAVVPEVVTAWEQLVGSAYEAPFYPTCLLKFPPTLPNNPCRSRCRPWEGPSLFATVCHALVWWQQTVRPRCKG